MVKITATDLDAEVFQDRAAANKKYAGITLEVTGEVNTRGGTGAVISLKGGIDENTMKALLVSVTMKLDERGSAEKIQAGETVTVIGALLTVNSTTTSVVLKDGALKK